MKRPAVSLPKAFDEHAGLEAAYRFLNNQRVTSQEILLPHHSATAARIEGESSVLLLHDTSEIRFPGSVRREGLGHLPGKGQGFFSHVSLAVTEFNVPMGVLAFSTWTRDAPDPKRKRERGIAGRRGEYSRWATQALEAAARLPSETRAIHVIDREGDSYALFDALSKNDFVIRAQSDRLVLSSVLNAEKTTLRAAAARKPLVFEREVRLTRRQPPEGKTAVTSKHHAPRDARLARLGVTACPVTFCRTKGMPEDLPEHLVLNVVRVFETQPPPDAEPVQWLLVTTLSIGTAEEIARVVDCYRTRWLIEEFFKALKSGCRIEERQLESLHALLNATAMFVPIAWQMLALRSIDRTTPDQAADQILTPIQLEVLHSLPGTKLPPTPTVHDAFLVIARLGGHIRYNGPPGWQTLAAGFSRLRWLQAGWEARDRGCDQ